MGFRGLSGAKTVANRGSIRKAPDVRSGTLELYRGVTVLLFSDSYHFLEIIMTACQLPASTINYYHLVPIITNYYHCYQFLSILSLLIKSYRILSILINRYQLLSINIPNYYQRLSMITKSPIDF